MSMKSAEYALKLCYEKVQNLKTTQNILNRTIDSGVLSKEVEKEYRKRLGKTQKDLDHYLKMAYSAKDAVQAGKCILQ